MSIVFSFRSVSKQILPHLWSNRFEEQAFWFYEDFYADCYENLPHLRTKSFAKKVLLRSLDYLDNDASDV